MDQKRLSQIEALLTSLADEGLGAVFSDQTVKSQCLASLSGVGCKAPANALVYFCLTRVFTASTSFLGKAASSRLAPVIASIPLLGDWLEKISNLHKQTKDKTALKAALIAEMQAMAPGSKVDDSLEFEVTTALFQQKKLQGLSSEFGGLFDGLESDLKGYFQDLFEPNLAWSSQQSSTPSVANAIRYDSHQYDFVGRDRELALLLKFAGALTVDDPRNAFRWLIVTGAGGEGKTRLAFEFTGAAPQSWKAGKLHIADLDKFDAAKWMPRQPTFMVVDYAAQSPEAVGKILAAFERRAAEFSFPVRVLLLERDVTGSWFKRMLPPGGDTPKVLEHCFGLNLWGGHYELPPLEPAIIAQLMTKRFVDAGVTPPPPAFLLSAACKVDDREFLVDGERHNMPRALFAVATAEVLLRQKDEPSFSYQNALNLMTRESVLDSILERDRYQRWAPAAKNDDVTRELHENLLALATIVQGLPREAFQKASLGAAENFLPARSLQHARPLSIDLMAQMCGCKIISLIPALEPDILGERFVETRLEALAQADPAAARALIDFAYAQAAFLTAGFAYRFADDLPQSGATLRRLAPTEDAPAAAAIAFAYLTPGLAHYWGGRGQWRELESIYAKLDVFEAKYPDTAEIFTGDAASLVDLCSKAGNDQQWGVISWSLERLRALSERFDNASMNFFEAAALHNVAHDAAQWKNQNVLFAALGRLDELTERWRASEEIALESAKAQVKLCQYFGATEKWEGFATAFSTLEQLRGRFPSSAPLAFETAQAFVNVVMAGALHNRTDLIEFGEQGLDALSSDFSHAKPLAELDLRGQVNVGGHAAVAKEWPRCDAAIARGRKIFELFPEDSDVAVMFSFLLSNVALGLCQHGRLADAVPLIDELRALSSTFANNGKIAENWCLTELTYYDRARAHGATLTPQRTELAVRAAGFALALIQANAIETPPEHCFWTIKDANEQHGDVPYIANAYQHLVKLGVDMESIN
jgi:hypothetical protein